MVFMNETVRAVVLYSAWCKTVAGCEWKKIYLASLSASKRKKVKFQPVGTTFKFDAGKKILSDEGIEILYIIGGQKITVISAKQYPFYC